MQVVFFSEISFKKKKNRYAATKELKQNAFTNNIQNINQEIGVQVTLILEVNPQKYVFYKN